MSPSCGSPAASCAAGGSGRPAAKDLRPTTERVREAVFSILGDVAGARVLDLFCGSGALGIEALSRGAAEATLVDTKPGAARRNVEELGLDERAPGRSAPTRALPPAGGAGILRSRALRPAL